MTTHSIKSIYNQNGSAPKMFVANSERETRLPDQRGFLMVLGAEPWPTVPYTTVRAGAVKAVWAEFHVHMDLSLCVGMN